MSKLKSQHPQIQRRYRTPPGTTPGTLIADPNARATEIILITYNAQAVVKQVINEPLAIKSLLTKKQQVVWVHVTGLGDVQKIAAIGELFNLHSLALEDVINTHQRPKVDDYQTHQFIVTYLVTLDSSLKLEQISLFLGKNFVISFSESPVYCFNAIEKRIEKLDSRFRSHGADYLAYALLDAVIDCYFPILETYSLQIDDLEDEVVLAPRANLVAKMHRLKRIFSVLKRDIWMQREMLNSLYRDENPLIQKETSFYFRDCYDHTIQIIELLETQRERCTSLTDIYLSSMANRLNEIMKVLTIISTIFMPLSFLASLWGMNFSPDASKWNMPELRWQWGYLMALGTMAATALSFLTYFWRRKWIKFGGKK